MSLTFKTMEEFLASMKDRIAANPNVPDLNTSEGTFADGILRAAATELANASFEQQALLAAIFPDENSGDYIEQHANDVGIIRKSGTRAVAEVTFAGADGTIVAAGTAVQTQSGLVFVTDTEVQIEGGTATATVTATESGSKYNVAENAISCLQSRGSVTVEASTAATGGTDPETDAALLSRLQAFRQEAPAGGNAAQYRAWAMEVDGIGAAKVIERHAGVGTVKVVLADKNMLPATDFVDEVAAYIEQRREVCVLVTCAAAASVNISVRAEVAVAEGVSAASVQTAFASLLLDYLRQLALTGKDVVYNRVAALLLSVPGVEDYAVLTVNGGTVNVALAEDAVPVLQEVVVS